MQWAYGVTTVQERRHTHLPQTLAALSRAGFDCPRLFVDGCDDESLYSDIGGPVTIRRERCRTVLNWILGMWELYGMQPHADRYAMFQDDFTCVRNMRQYLEQLDFPQRGYINLYTFPTNQARCQQGFRGLFMSDQLGKGAVGLVFTREGLQTLFSEQEFIGKVTDVNGHKSLDGCIVNAMKRKGWREYCHSPSLLQHTGYQSSMGSQEQPLARHYPGDDFDALTYLEPHKMNEQQALARMVPPGQRRKGIWREGVLQIWVTRACDKSCFGCTQGSNLGGKPGMMTPDQFAAALDSIKGYFGVVGMFGGNPAISPHFEEMCRILREKVPFEQRGLWCNNPLGKAAIMRETFNPAVSNLNVHLDKAAYDEFVDGWKECKPFLKGLDQDSRHGPPFVGMMDVGLDESTRWEMIAGCDVNQRWSAMIGVFRGELRAWVCELMGAQSMLHQTEPDYPDTGLPVVPGWWQRPMQDFAEQVRFHCHRCGIPLKGWGALATTGPAEQVSECHKSIFKPKQPQRLVELVVNRSQLGEKHLPRATDYIENGGLA